MYSAYFHALCWRVRDLQAWRWIASQAWDTQLNDVIPARHIRHTLIAVDYVVGVYNSLQISKKMSVFHDEIEIEDFEYDEDTDTYYFPCPCGDKFAITKVRDWRLL